MITISDTEIMNCIGRAMLNNKPKSGLINTIKYMKVLYSFYLMVGRYIKYNRRCLNGAALKLSI